MVVDKSKYLTTFLLRLRQSFFFAIFLAPCARRVSRARGAFFTSSLSPLAPPSAPAGPAARAQTRLALALRRLPVLACYDQETMDCARLSQ